MAFQATKRSIRTSAGLRSCSWIFFLMRDWFLDRDDPFLLRPLARELARERLVCSGPDKFMGLEGKKEAWNCLKWVGSNWRQNTNNTQQSGRGFSSRHTNTYHSLHPSTTMNSGLQNIVISLGAMQCLLILLFFGSFALKNPNSSGTQDTLWWPAGTQLCTPGICRFSNHHAWCILLRLYSCTTPLVISVFISPYDIYHQIKRKNDQTVLKYGKSTLSYVISLLTFFFTTVEPPAPMVCVLRTTNTQTYIF